MNDKNVLDRKFLEFWGNLFLNIAKGQEQIEQISSLMNMDSIKNMDFMNFKDMEKMFRNVYELPSDIFSKEKSGRLEQKIDEKETLKLRESFDAFQSSFAKYITLWGWIPKKTHDDLKQNYDILKHEHETLKQSYDDLKQSYEALKKNYDTLKQKADIQDDLISQLRDILNEKGMGHVELFHHIQNLTRKQTKEFQHLIQNLQNLFKIGDGK